MHIVIMVAVGLAILALIQGAAHLFGRDGASRTVARASGFFAVLWLGVSAVDFYLGVTQAGFSVAAETAAHAAIFGVPGAVALFLAIRASRRDPARPA